MTSPGSRPAIAAGPSGSTFVTSAPRSTAKLFAYAIWGVTLTAATLSDERTTRPLADQVADHGLRHVDGNRKADTVSRRDERRVDAHDPSDEVEERPARISRD